MSEVPLYPESHERSALERPLPDILLLNFACIRACVSERVSE